MKYSQKHTELKSLEIHNRRIYTHIHLRQLFGGGRDGSPIGILSYLPLLLSFILLGLWPVKVKSQEFVYYFLEIFSVLMSYMVNINRYNLHQKFFGGPQF